jgi:hypothetical protein
VLSVTGREYDELVRSLTSVLDCHIESNRAESAPQTSLSEWSQDSMLGMSVSEVKMVGAIGFEPTTPCSRSRCATRLRYAPNLWLASTHRAEQQNASVCVNSRGRLTYPNRTSVRLSNTQSPSCSVPGGTTASFTGAVPLRSIPSRSAAADVRSITRSGSSTPRSLIRTTTER